MLAELSDILAPIVAIFPCALSLYLIITACIQVLWREAVLPASTEDALRVTVLVPAHNEERTLTGCLDALVASTHPGLAIHVVSDGSKDAPLFTSTNPTAKKAARSSLNTPLFLRLLVVVLRSPSGSRCRSNCSTPPSPPHSARFDTPCPASAR